MYYFFTVFLAKKSLKAKFLIIIFLLFNQIYFGQNLYLKIISNQKEEAKTLDSISYQKKHKDVKSIENEINIVSKILNQKGYLTCYSEKLQKENDSTFTTKLTLGEKTPYLYVIKNEYTKTLNKKKDTLQIKTEQIEHFLNQNTIELEKKGQPLAQVYLVNFRKLNNKLFADLNIINETIRKIDNITLEGNHKFPKNHLLYLKKQFLNKTYNESSLKKLTKEIEKFNFIKQTKKPEGLFTKDSTKVYIYLNNNKSNTFDGFIGFNNIENKLNLNGYLDLKLSNILNSGEKFNLFWKSSGSQQKTFETNIELPYIFKSAFALKGQLNIFKQDSTFQSGKTEINLGYYFKQNIRIYAGYQNTESSDIQNKKNITISDFKSNFFTSEFNYNTTDPKTILFTEKTKINIKIGIGKRDNYTQKNQQFYAQTNFSQNIFLNNKNIIFFSNQNFYLKSNNYFINELYRFGGSNSIRGFNENSLQANLSSFLLTEYRYLFNSNFYIHSIIDYGYFEDKTSSYSSNLKSFGLGFGLSTNKGIFNFALAKGITKTHQNTSQTSIFHITYKLLF